MKTEQLKNDFLRLCEELQDRPDVLYTEVAEHKKDCVFTLYLRAIRVELVYCWKWETLAPPSVLYCRFYLSKNENLFLHLPELIAHLGTEDYRACYFPYIENTQRMECCFHALMALVDDYIPHAEKIAQSGKAEQLMKSWFARSFFDTEAESATTLEYDNPEERQYMARINYTFESLMVGRHTDFGPYEAVLLGNWDKALKKYRKQEKHGLSAYERGLCRFMEEPKNRDFQPMPKECFALPAYKAFKRPVKDLLGMVAAWLPCAVVLCAITAVINAVLARGTLYHFGMPFLGAAVFAGLPGVFGYLTFQQRIWGLLGRKQDRDFYSMMDNHPGINKFAAMITALCVIASLWACIGLPQLSARFYDIYAVCSLEEPGDLRFDYDQVEAVYYIRGRYNEYGGLVKRGSYVLVLDDGTCVDLDGQAGKKDQKKLIEDLFGEYEVIVVETDWDLPNGGFA